MTEKEYNRIIKYIEKNQFVGRYADGWTAWCCDCIAVNKLKPILKSMLRSTMRMEQKKKQQEQIKNTKK